MIVQEFDLTIRHRSGKSNTHADALSRNPVALSEEISCVRAVQTLDHAAEVKLAELVEEQGKGSRNLNFH